MISAAGLGPFESAGPALVWAIVLTFVFLECAVILGLFLPGDSMLITAGIVLSTHTSGAGHVWALSFGAMIAAICGNHVGYRLGHRAGDRILARRGGKYLTAENLHKVNTLLDRHGFWAVLVARWIPWVRTLCPLVSGAARMNHTKFTVASTLGAIVWAPVLLLAGFYAGGYLSRAPWLLPVILLALVAMLVVGTVVGVRQYRQEMARPIDEVVVDEVATT
ncbi:DedA family protein [Rhodococcus triatomae]|uniref:Membrane-associated protein n=1 Tax=Rhodococcus triatomae TaxID=300028 RepID=A0A1G8PJE8_9NOCA|nr:DedA family protein [Rhodococcus triatomae]QNG20106.1 DedA family protein [Rhodococcus triatomae]QNG23978.1 DedA family protein [Rhodococcus triatomae]SDI91950.1 membrane-associated protein [Rhodococcus triatomae]